ncbi:uncharacterized protein GGS22DRAFT_80056 [Annulohypoxylon maeteangense]|uniref:uncharacterized protein n=1 Tax=Annulohypoxylon maeteangense TaxID=1927788 RepID=UPI0020089674|nr:uncharacterized protein GGS22DRAFT_80056 [Annulohypoxylon maeteangense]KAI0880775.1 hypothetical protein GGS22DRAFT_80056 [Annulohypoxylon maeteangense]
MDWHAEDASWSNRDFGIFQYEQRRTVVLRKLESNPTVVRSELRDKQEWEDWFCYDAPSTNPTESGLYVALCSRATPVFEGSDMPVTNVPVTSDTWERLTREFLIHREIRRPISRGVDYFTSHRERDKGGESKIYFVARMSASLPKDLALSVTYIPSKDTTFAVIYGCNEEQMQDIEQRINKAGDKTKFPLLMVGLLAELERERLLDEAEDLIDDFTLRSDYFDSESNKIAADISNEKTQEYVSLCFKSRSLMDHIKAVKHQLAKLIAEIDNFAIEGKRTRRFHKHGALMKNKVLDIIDECEFHRHATLMKKRVLDIIDEYDVKINECKMIVEDTTLATQTAYNQIARMDSAINTMIARQAKLEGTQMRSIALLTMIYLPFSSVAAIFSMDMFDWKPQTGGSVVSKYIWVFAAFATGLTAITFFAWYHITSRHDQIKPDASWEQGKLV